MKKFFLIIFIIANGLIISASAWFLAVRIKTNRSPTLSEVTSGLPLKTPSVQSPKTPAGPTPPTPANSFSSTPDVPASVVSTAPGARKIGFSYRNSKARKVEIRADFTGWRAEPMQKDANNIWKYMAVLDPGEYAYCFYVDEKSIRDPANKRTKQVGKTVVSSINVPPIAAGK